MAFASETRNAVSGGRAPGCAPAAAISGWSTI
jgi:hypothetical protein